MKPIRILILAAALLTGLAACRKESGPSPAGYGALEVRIARTGMETRSLIPESREEAVSEMTLAAYDRHGALEQVRYVAAGSGTLTLDRNAAHTIVVLTNLGDLTASLPPTLSGLEALTIPLSSFSVFAAKGLPAAGREPLAPGWTDGSPLEVPVDRLVAKVVLTIDHSRLSGEAKGAVTNSRVRIRQANRILRPFAEGGSRAGQASDLFSVEETDGDDALALNGGDEVRQTVTLYLPENRQGRSADLASYIELAADKTGDEDGVSGGLTYRFHLRDGADGAYDVKGNCRYIVTLALSWNGMYIEDTWRADRTDWEDRRQVRLTDEGAVAEVREIPVSIGGSQVRYAYFSRGNGRVYGARETPGEYPYGWVLSIAGETVPSVTRAGNLVGQGLSWQYDDGADRLTVRASATAAIGTTVPIRLETFDGQQWFDAAVKVAAEPLGHEWAHRPAYVAQQGVLTATKSTGGARVTFRVTEGADIVRLHDNGDNTATVSAIGAGSAAILMEATATGQTGEVLLTVAAPHIAATGAVSLWIDGTEATLPARYETADGAGMSVASSDADGHGLRFSPSLYAELLDLQAAPGSDLDGFIGISDGKVRVCGFTGASRNGIGSVLGRTFENGIRVAARDCAAVPPTGIRTTLVNPVPLASPTPGRIARYDDWTLLGGRNNSYATTKTYTCSGLQDDFRAQPDNISFAAVPRDGSTCSNTAISYTASPPRITVKAGIDGHHAGGKVDIMAVIRNTVSGETYRASIGYLETYLHMALGGKVLAHREETVLDGEGLDQHHLRYHYTIGVDFERTYARADAFAEIRERLVGYRHIIEASFADEGFTPDDERLAWCNRPIYLSGGRGPFSRSDFNMYYKGGAIISPYYYVESAYGFATQLYEARFSTWDSEQVYILDDSPHFKFNTGEAVGAAFRQVTDSDTGHTRLHYAYEGFTDEEGLGYYVLHKSGDISQQPYGWVDWFWRQ